MEKRFGWGSLFLIAAAGCTGETVTAPGACPAYCVGVLVQATDTVMPMAIFGDTTVSGYVSKHVAGQMMMTSPGVATPSRGVLRFYRYADTIPLNLGDTARRAILQTDSFQVQIEVARQTRGVSGMRLAFYRLPVNIDSLTTFETLDPYFNDSTFVTDVAVPSADSSDTVKVTFPSTLVPTFAIDSSAVALGVALRSPSPAFVTLKTSEAGFGASLTRFVQVDSLPGVRVSRSISAPTFLDTYVFPALAPPAAGALAVGGAPSQRAFLRLSVPSRIVDSSDVVRATLLLFPAAPVSTAPGDTLHVVARPVATDIGAKSPVLAATADTLRGAAGRAAPGSVDTVKVDFTDIIRSWKNDTTKAHTVVLATSPEAGGFGQLQFWSSADPARRPRLEITYVPPIQYQGR